MRNPQLERSMLQPIYENGGSFRQEAYQAFCNAKRLLNSSRLCINIHHVRHILILLGEYRKHITQHTTQDSEILIGGFKA
ncbi:MAG: hypothetical protein KUA38_16085, partial [Hydrogenophaga sp.]|nr:hypothetical protein [Hydrogenophaga sp.]